MLGITRLSSDAIDNLFLKKITLSAEIQILNFKIEISCPPNVKFEKLKTTNKNN